MRINLNVPLFQAKIFRDKIIIVGGGGGKNVGVRNYLFVLDLKTKIKLQEIELDYIFDKILLNEEKGIVMIGCEEKIEFFKFQENELKRLQKLSFKPQETMPFYKFDFQGDLLIRLFDEQNYVVSQLDFDQEKFNDIYEGKEKEIIWYMKILQETRRILFLRKTGKFIVLDLELKSLVDESNVIFKEKSEILHAWKDPDYDSYNFIETADQKQQAVRVTVLENDIDYLRLESVKEPIADLCTFEDILVSSNKKGEILIYKYNSLDFKLNFLQKIKVSDLGITSIDIYPIERNQQKNIIQIMTTSIEGQLVFNQIDIKTLEKT